MKKELTKKQKKVFDIIKDFIEENGYSPTIREIGSINETAPSTTLGYLRRLKNKGYIDYIESKSRTIRIIK